MIDLACGIREDGHWHCTYGVRIDADALRRLGLHPEPADVRPR